MKRLALVLVLFAAGCCSVDHERQAAFADQQIATLEKAAALSDEELGDVQEVRRLIANEIRSWGLARDTSLEVDKEEPK